MLDWTLFLTIIVILISLDLNLFNSKGNVMSFRKSLQISSFYIILGMLFGLWVWYHLGDVAAKNYYNAYIVEKILSLDNIFIISLIFSYLKIPSSFQHRVLFWGILGVIIFRGLMIGLGTALIERFEFVLYIFGAILVITGIKMLILVNKKPSLKGNFIIKLTNKYCNVEQTLTDERFLIVKKGKFYITRLTIALLLVETMDLIFAIDSIPAAFAITTDTYIVYTSNILAIMGLRALYFCLNDMIKRFHYLKYSLAIILVFIGSKIFIKHIIEFSAGTSLFITVAIIAAGIVKSVTTSKKQKI
jgi:tellurite resistance protein TerC